MFAKGGFAPVNCHVGGRGLGKHFEVEMSPQQVHL